MQRSLTQTLRAIGQTNQVIYTTHSPHFVSIPEYADVAGPQSSDWHRTHAIDLPLTPRRREERGTPGLTQMLQLLQTVVDAFGFIRVEVDSFLLLPALPVTVDLVRARELADVVLGEALELLPGKLPFR